MPDDNPMQVRPVRLSIHLNRSDCRCLLCLVICVCGPTILQLKSTAESTPSHVESCGFRLDLNSASLEELILLPGIGESRAAAIVRYRQKSGPFKSTDELVLIKGIGPKTLSGLISLVYVEKGSQPTTERVIVSSSLPNGQVPWPSSSPKNLD